MAVGLCCAGGYLAFSEARTYLAGGVLPKERFAALLAGKPLGGLSIESNRLVLDNCREALSGVYGRLQPTARRNEVAANCLTAADAIVRAMPTNSYAWFVAALAAAGLGDEAGLAARLHQSQLTGPYEQWIAEMRVNLAEDHLDQLPPDVLASNDGDLAMLVTSRRGIASIAGRYVKDPAFRERITAIVEGLSQEDQKRFLANVQTAAGRS